MSAGQINKIPQVWQSASSLLSFCDVCNNLWFCFQFYFGVWVLHNEECLPSRKKARCSVSNLRSVPWEHWVKGVVCLFVRLLKSLL